MMLCDVPPKTRVRFGDLEVDFDHIDGMYSLCYNGGDIVHLPAWTEVEIVEVEK